MRILGLIISLCSILTAHAQWRIDYDVLRAAQTGSVRSINTEGLEFSPSFYFDNDIIFIRPGEEGRRDRAIGETYFEIAGSDAAPFEQINAVNEHIGPLSLDMERSILYYTQSKRKKRKRKRPVNQLMYAELESGVWIPKGALSFCQKGIAYQHPTLGSDGRTMVFASNAGGKERGYDLYVSTMGDSTWSEPLALGDMINTDANEAFPYLYQDSLLFFASNREDGLGGYDVYVSIYQHGAWQKAINLGFGINTPYDDFGLILDQAGTTGYLSSNRPGGAGKDDIYKVSFDRPLAVDDAKYNIAASPTSRQLVELNVNVKNIKDSSTVEGAFVSLIPFSDLDVTSTDVSSEDNAYLLSIMPKQSNDIQTVITDTDGSAVITAYTDIDYLVTFQKLGFKPYTLSLNRGQKLRSVDVTMEPTMSTEPKKEEQTPEPKNEPEPQPVEQPKQEVVEEKPVVELPPIEDREILVFDQLYYERSSSEISSGSTGQLDMLAEYMMRYPDMTVELTAHTDSRGYRAFNQKLSQKRADSAKNYLVAKGIAERRIIALGKGEDQIRNHCTNGVYCTEKEHEYNRRTEVKVVYD